MRKYDEKFDARNDDFDDADIMEKDSIDDYGDEPEDFCDEESGEDEEDEDEDPVLAARMPEPGEDAEDVDDLEHVKKAVKRRNSSEDDYLSGALPVHKRLPQDPKPTQAKLKQIYKDYHSGDPYLKDQATTKMLGIMSPYILGRITKKYGSYMANHLEDLQEQGYMGVLKGLPSFDPDKGRPTTWFIRYIDHEIQVYISEQIHNSSTYYAGHSKQVYKCIEERVRNGLPYTTEDIMIETGLPKKTIENILSVRNAAIAPMEGEASNTLKSNYETPEDAAIRTEAQELVHDLLNNTASLTYEEKVCLMLRYNIQDPDPEKMKKYIDYMSTHNAESDDEDLDDSTVISMNAGKMHSFTEVEKLAKAVYGLDISKYFASRLVPVALAKLKDEHGRLRRAKACHRIRTECQSNLTGEMISKVTMKKDQEAVAEFFDTGILKI